MQADNRRSAGGVRHYLPATVLALFAALPAVCLSSASGAALWSKVEFSAFTTLGILHLKLSTTMEDAGLRLDQFRMDVDGRPLRIPGGVDLRVMKPQLNAVEVITTRSITCIGDICPEPGGWPVYVDLPFGNYAGADGGECEHSMLRFDLEADAITDITMWICQAGKQIERVLYSREDAGTH